MEREYFKLPDGRLVEMPNAEEEATINAGIAADPDTYELTEEEFKQLRPISERVGRPKSDVVKEQLTIRLDPKVVAHFRSTGKGWQTRINDALRAHIEKS